MDRFAATISVLLATLAGSGVRPNRDKATALVVHGTPATLRALDEKLTEAGYDVAPVGDFQEARRAIELCAPDILMTGVQLGQFNGLHLAILYKQMRPDGRVVVLTTYEDDVLSAEAARIGAEWVVLPPAPERA